MYTGRFVGGKNAFEQLLAQLGVRQKNGHPGHPTTQGKVERFHQTLKKRLRSLRPAETIAELQAQLDAFREYYNERRPHRALDGNTSPGVAYRATLKAAPSGNGGDAAHYRIRHDKVDKLGLVTLRHAGRLHHLGVGAAHAREHVIILVDATSAIVIHQATGEILAATPPTKTRTTGATKTRAPAAGRSSKKKSGTSAP